MTVYKYFIKIAMRHKWIIISYTAIFLLLSIINSSNTETEEDIFMESRFNIGIIDKSNNSLSRELLDYLRKDNNIYDIENDKESYIKEQIFIEKIDLAILIPANFEERFKKKEKSLEIIGDDRKMQSFKIENDINKFLVFLNASHLNNKLHMEKVKQALSEETRVEVLNTLDSSQSDNINTWFKNYFNFTGYVIIAIYIAVIGIVMTELNNKAIKDRISISPKRFISFNAQVYLGQATLTALITLFFIWGSILLKGKYLSDIFFLKYIVNIYLFSFAILCLTFLISNLTTNKFVINVASTALSLGTSFISGVFVPQELLGENVLNISKFFPTYYFIKINETKISSLFDIKYEIFMQVLFSVTFLLIGLYFSKTKINQGA